MKIIALQAENIKKLVAVEIRPDGNLVQITGKNGQGKTSVLDCIWWALAGASHIQAAPIRTGAAQARIRLDMGEIIVTRTFKPSKDGENITSSIIVENAAGARFQSPQKMLDELIGSLSFDPLSFARMDPKQQFNELRKFVPDVDFDEIDNLNRADYQKRTEINRQHKELTAAAAEIKVDPKADLPKQKIDESALISEIEKAGERNTAIEREKNRRDNISSEIISSRADADNLTAQANQLLQKAAKLEQLAKEQEDSLSKLDPIPEPIDVSDIRAKIDNARMINAEIENVVRQNSLLQGAEKLAGESKAISERMAERQLLKEKKIAGAKLPVDGIGFGDGVVLMNGVPFDQASDAEQLRTSLAIAMSLNPKIKVIRVRDGSLLDEDSLKLVAEMAAAKDYQVWIERVDGSGKIGFVLEDGSIKPAPAAV